MEIPRPRTSIGNGIIKEDREHLVNPLEITGYTGNHLIGQQEPKPDIFGIAERLIGLKEPKKQKVNFHRRKLPWLFPGIGRSQPKKIFDQLP